MHGFVVCTLLLFTQTQTLAHDNWVFVRLSIWSLAFGPIVGHVDRVRTNKTTNAVTRVEQTHTMPRQAHHRSSAAPASSSTFAAQRSVRAGGGGSPSKRKLGVATDGGARRHRVCTDNKGAGRRLPLDVEARIIAMATCGSMHKALVVFRTKSPRTYHLVMQKNNVRDRIVSCANEWQRKVGGIDPPTNTSGARVGGLPKHTKIWCRLRTNAGILYVVGTIPQCWHPLQYIESYDGRAKQVGAVAARVHVTDADAANAGFVDEEADEDDTSSDDDGTEQAYFVFMVRVVDMLPNVFAETAASATTLFARVDAMRPRLLR